MLSLLLTTLAMMGFTFLIGFFVAAVIKGIAATADSMEFFSTHQEELQRLRRIKKMRSRLASLLRNRPGLDEPDLEDERENWKQGLNPDVTTIRTGYYHGVSPGASKMDLIDYYYPDTKMVYLKKQSELLDKKKAHTKKTLSPKK